MNDNDKTVCVAESADWCLSTTPDANIFEQFELAMFDASRTDDDGVGFPALEEPIHDPKKRKSD